MKFDLSNTVSFSAHRHGWGYVMSSIRDLHSKPGIHLCDFIEKDFGWDASPSFSHKKKWCGFFHNPPNVPSWFDFHNAPQSIIERDIFKKYLPNCLCIFTLSEYLKNFLEKHLDIPIFALKHPTCLQVKKWNPDKFLRNKKVVQVGYWLRKMYSITTITKKYKLEWLPSDYDYALHKRKEEAFATGWNMSELKKMWSKVEVFRHLSNEDYDDKLTNSVILCDMYDSSANNAVIESITRCSPIIAPKIPAVTEYLGEDYPLYIDGPIDNCLYQDRIISAYEYLLKLDKEFLNTKHFNLELKKCLLKLKY